MLNIATGCKFLCEAFPAAKPLCTFADAHPLISLGFSIGGLFVNRAAKPALRLLDERWDKQVAGWIETGKDWFKKKSQPGRRTRRHRH